MAVQNMPFIENMEKRIQNASSLLDTSLGHTLVDGLEHRDANAVYNCLRAYAAIDNTKNAEDIFRSTVVAPLIQKVIPQSLGVSGASGDELEQDYKKIKQYIVADCKFLLDISSTGMIAFAYFLLIIMFLHFGLDNLHQSFLVHDRYVSRLKRHYKFYAWFSFPVMLCSNELFQCQMQKTQAYMYRASLQILSLKRFTLPSKKENRECFLLEDLQSS